MPLFSTGDNALSRAAAHLHAAIFLALDRAGADADELLSPWANTADAITLAWSGLSAHLSGPPEPVEHTDCRTALLAAAAELAQLRAGIDVPVADLVSVVEFLVPALLHVHADVSTQSVQLGSA